MVSRLYLVRGDDIVLHFLLSVCVALPHEVFHCLPLRVPDVEG